MLDAKRELDQPAHDQRDLRPPSRLALPIPRVAIVERRCSRAEAPLIHLRADTFRPATLSASTEHDRAPRVRDGLTRVLLRALLPWQTKVSAGAPVRTTRRPSE